MTHAEDDAERGWCWPGSSRRSCSPGCCTRARPAPRRTIRSWRRRRRIRWPTSSACPSRATSTSTRARRTPRVYILNVQPVIPIHLTDDWNLITRTIMPIINQPSLFPDHDTRAPSAWGTSIRRSSSRRPKPGRSSGAWARRSPSRRPPTRLLGSGKFSLGPTAVALTIQGPWVFGALINQPVVGGGLGRQGRQPDAASSPSSTTISPHGWYLTSSPS